MHKPMSRRNILALALAGGTLTTPLVSQAEAAKLLEAPFTDPVPELGASYATDPARFAGTTDSDISGYADLVDYIGTLGATGHAEYVQARTAFVRAYPQFLDVPYDHPFTRMDEASFGWPVVAYMEGLRAGAAYEHLRLALVGTPNGCPTCEGIGTIGATSHDRYEGGPTTCPTCGGSGITRTITRNMR